MLESRQNILCALAHKRFASTQAMMKQPEPVAKLLTSVELIAFPDQCDIRHEAADSAKPPQGEAANCPTGMKMESDGHTGPRNPAIQVPCQLVAGKVQRRLSICPRYCPKKLRQPARMRSCRRCVKPNRAILSVKALADQGKFLERLNGGNWFLRGTDNECGRIGCSTGFHVKSLNSG